MISESFWETKLLNEYLKEYDEDLTEFELEQRGLSKEFFEPEPDFYD